MSPLQLNAEPRPQRLSTEDQDSETLKEVAAQADEERQSLREKKLQPLQGARRALRSSDGKPTCDNGHDLLAELADDPTCRRCGATASGPMVIVTCTEAACKLVTCATTEHCAPQAMARAMRALYTKYDPIWAEV